MLTLKLKADNLRLLKAAKTEPELRGAVDLVLELAQQAETLKSFGRTASDGGKFGWRQALDVLRSILGDSLIVPPFPTSYWFVGIRQAMTSWGMDEAYIRALGEKAKTSLRAPYSADFLIRQAARIMAGAYDNQAGRQSVSMNKATFRKDVLPEE